MMGKMKDLRELFEVELRYAYDCEHKLVNKGLPAMIENASSPELRTALQHHLGETRSHEQRVEAIFRAIGAEPKTTDNEVLDKMMSAAKDSVGHIEESPLRDMALIANGNIVEHYEIALYGTLASYARALGLRDVVATLDQILAEEKAADAKLTQLAETSANAKGARYASA